MLSDDSFSNLQISYVSFTYYSTFDIQFFMRNFESVFKDDVLVRVPICFMIHF